MIDYSTGRFWIYDGSADLGWSAVAARGMQRNRRERILNRQNYSFEDWFKIPSQMSAIRRFNKIPSQMLYQKICIVSFFNFLMMLYLKNTLAWRNLKLSSCCHRDLLMTDSMNYAGSATIVSSTWTSEWVDSLFIFGPPLTTRHKIKYMLKNDSCPQNFAKQYFAEASWRRQKDVRCEALLPKSFRWANGLRTGRNKIKRSFA
jgi:hypothetical protein